MVSFKQFPENVFRSAECENFIFDRIFVRYHKIIALLLLKISSFDRMVIGLKIPYYAARIFCIIHEIV